MYALDVPADFFASGVEAESRKRPRGVLHCCRLPCKTENDSFAPGGTVTFTGAAAAGAEGAGTAGAAVGGAGAAGAAVAGRRPARRWAWQRRRQCPQAFC
jgi:hypothetical protein